MKLHDIILSFNDIKIWIYFWQDVISKLCIKNEIYSDFILRRILYIIKLIWNYLDYHKINLKKCIYICNDEDSFVFWKVVFFRLFNLLIVY